MNLPSDVAFTNYLATIDIARLSDYEFRLYRYLRLTRTESN